MLHPSLMEGPLSTFYFIGGCELRINKARAVDEEEEEKTIVDTTKVFIISMGFKKGGTFKRDIKKGGFAKGVMNTYTFLGSGAFVLTSEAISGTKLD